MVMNRETQKLSELQRTPPEYLKGIGEVHDRELPPIEPPLSTPLVPDIDMTDFYDDGETYDTDEF